MKKALEFENTEALQVLIAAYNRLDEMRGKDAHLNRHWRLGAQPK